MEFDDTSKQYKILSVLHVKYASISCALIGALLIVTAFSLGVTYLPWSCYDTSFVVVALIGLLIFFILGVAVHYMILLAIRFTKIQFVTPFVIFHVFLISLNIIVSLIAVGEMVAEQRYQLDLSFSAARTVLVVVPIAILVEVVMLVIVVKLRFYLRNKRRHIRHGLPPRPTKLSNKCFHTLSQVR
ncbi:hypothetical protein Angca_001471 [Angiostrongylus cantonensis]|nr:hypothetical protein Angca_001471 [Angiostrongylus cantonensis]